MKMLKCQYIEFHGLYGRQQEFGKQTTLNNGLVLTHSMTPLERERIKREKTIEVCMIG
jgi:hypothetical protein